MSCTPHKIRVTEDMIINDMGIEKVSNFFINRDKKSLPNQMAWETFLCLFYTLLGSTPRSSMVSSPVLRMEWL